MVASGSDTEESDGEDTPRKRANTFEEDDEEDAFLPTLHTGFIPATEGDDWSDAEADYADTGGKGPAKSQRKNRRGQRE
ncbi:BUD22 family protein, partial [Cutibacterium acnes subsp. acnes]|nr:BUD22 family protein [Cutibacterium acnes subsp. acnes]